MSYIVRSSLWVSWDLSQIVETMFVWCDVQNGLLVIIWRHSSYGEAGWALIHPRISAQSISLEQSVVDSIMIVVLSCLLHSEHLRKHFILFSGDQFVRAKFAPCLCVFFVFFYINPCFSIILYYNVHFIFFFILHHSFLDWIDIEWKNSCPGAKCCPSQRIHCSVTQVPELSIPF